MTTAYPLSWPPGWPRTAAHRRDSGRKFSGSVYGLTFERARRQLSEELRLLGATQVTISTNLPLRGDGLPYAGAAQRRMDDPGVAVYFVLNKKPLSMARDAYTDIAANMRSLGLAIAGLRQLERHGGSYMMERAFDGFAALPPPGGVKRSWAEVLGLAKPGILITHDAVDDAFRRLAKEHHPDAGGDPARMAELNAAREQAHDAIP